MQTPRRGNEVKGLPAQEGAQWKQKNDDTEQIDERPTPAAHVAVEHIDTHVIFLLQRIRSAEHECDGMHPDDRFLQPDEPRVEDVSHYNDDKGNDNHE